jgi:hypothetical protein
MKPSRDTDIIKMIFLIALPPSSTTAMTPVVA